MPRIQFFQNVDGVWQWHARSSGNGEIICHSEPYESGLDSAQDGAKVWLREPIILEPPPPEREVTVDDALTDVTGFSATAAFVDAVAGEIRKTVPSKKTPPKKK